MKHSHSFLGGLIGGLLLDQETMLVLLIGVAIGAAGSFLLHTGAGVVRWVRERLAAAGPYDHRNRPW